MVVTDSQVDSLKEDIRTLSDTVVQILDHVAAHDARFDGIEARLNAHDARFDGIDGRLDGIDGRLDGIDGTLQQILSLVGGKASSN